MPYDVIASEGCVCPTCETIRLQKTAKQNLRPSPTSYLREDGVWMRPVLVGPGKWSHVENR